MSSHSKGEEDFRSFPELGSADSAGADPALSLHLLFGWPRILAGGEPDFFLRLWTEITLRPLEFLSAVLFYGGLALLILTVLVNLVRLVGGWIASIE